MISKKQKIQKQIDPNQLYTRTQIMDLLSVSRSIMDTIVNTGKIKITVIGGRKKIRYSDYIRYLDECQQAE